MSYTDKIELTKSQKIKFVLYVFVFWTLWVILYTLVFLIQKEIPGWGIALFSSACYNYTFALLTVGIWFVCKKLPVTRFAIPLIIFIHFILSSLFTAFWLFIVYGSWYLHQGKIIFEIVNFNEIIGWQFLFGMMSYLLMAGIFYTIIYYNQFREKTMREAELKVLTKEAEFKALKMQINPHFLFNSLNSINALVKRNPNQSRKMIGLLSDLLRMSLESRDKMLVALKEELEFVHRYLEIENVRFGDRMEYVEDVDQRLMAYRVPAMILQPLLENSVKYGVARRRGKGKIMLSVKRTGAKLLFTISNTISSGLEEGELSRNGTGLYNIKKRLELLYSDEFDFTAGPSGDGNFEVKFTIPIKKDERD